MSGAGGRRVLVTGGGGFVGRHLVDALRARGDEVTVLEARGGPPRGDVRFIEGDVRDAATVRRALGGVTVVHHTASVVHTRRNRVQDVWSINLDGTRVLLDAAREAGVGRFVYVSTASAVYEGRDIEGGDERMPYSTISQAPYADSKIAAERLVLAASGADGLATCAVRPHVVFGPGDTRFLPAIVKRARAGKLKYGIGRGKLSDFTYVGNLVDALLLADDALAPGGAAAGQAYFVTNGEPMPFFEFVGRALAALDLPPIRGYMPLGLAYAAAAVAEAVDTLRGGTLGVEDGLSRFAVRYMGTHHYFSIDKARRQLGYEPRVSIDEGIRLTAEALRAAGEA